MKIAVSTLDLPGKDDVANNFATQLWKVLPGHLPEGTFLVDSSEPADQVLRFGAGFSDDDLPTTIVVTSVDHKLFPAKKGWRFWRKETDVLEQSVRAAAAILVPHAALRQQLVDQYGIPAPKIHVVGHGLPTGDQRITPADSVTRRITKEAYGNEHSYLLAPATGHVSDNLERLFAAYDLFRRRTEEPVRLLVEHPEAGDHPRAVKQAARRAEFGHDIVFLPLLSPADRRKVVSSARAIVHVSLSTAFPVPVLDAWTAEVPVLGTDNDVIQGAGTLVQANDVKRIAEGLVALTTTPFLASGLVENGKRRREVFNWEGVAERVEEVLGGNS